MNTLQQRRCKKRRIVLHSANTKRTPGWGRLKSDTDRYGQATRLFTKFHKSRSLKITKAYILKILQSISRSSKLDEIMQFISIHPVHPQNSPSLHHYPHHYLLTRLPSWRVFKCMVQSLRDCPERAQSNRYQSIANLSPRIQSNPRHLRTSKDTVCNCNTITGYHRNVS